jgi:nucleotide-binding universal stress UspA family protein
MGGILVPVDGSKHAEDALEYAIDHFSDEEITALHVVEIPQGYFTATAPDPEDIPQVKAQKGEANELLDDIEAKATEMSAVIETDFELGDPEDEILSYVEEHDIDEIVIGSRGVSGVGRIMFGSVAEKVVRRAEIPVVVVH